MDTLVQDVRYAFRQLLRSPGFTFVALTTLALAIGATTAIFSVVDGVLLRPLPFRNPERIVRVAETGRDGRPFPLSALDYIDFRDGARSFDGMAPYDRDNANLTGGGAQPLRLSLARVGDRFFDLLGVGAQVGRTFAAGDDKPGAPKVVVLGDAFWRSHFGADPRIVGQTLSLDGTPYTVIGVAPASLRFPSGSDIYTAYQFQPYEVDPQNRGAHSFWAVGRLKPGVTIATAKAELQGIAAHLATTFPQSNTGFGATVEDMREQLVGNVKPALYAMLGAVAFVLLIACANVANLLLVRAAARESEIAVRTALGAGRSRILRQLITESLMLAAGGAVLGAAIAAWAVDGVVALGPQGIPRLDEVAVNGQVLLFTAGLALVTGTLFGLVPALHVARPDISQMLRESVRGTSRGGHHRTRNALVVAEMALAVVLLVGAGLLIRSFARLTSVDPGFRPQNVVTFDVSVPDAKYDVEPKIRQFAYDVVERLQQIPGAQAAGASFGRPMGTGGHIATSFEIDGQPPSTPDNRRISEIYIASSGYFKALGIGAVRGRVIDAGDDRRGSAPVLVVNQELARKYFPGVNPIGKHLTFGFSHDTAGPNTGAPLVGEIVGIVPNVKNNGLSSDPAAAVYVPLSSVALNYLTFVVRSTADPAAVETAARQVMKASDPDLPIFGMQTMEHAVAESVSQPRFYAILLAVFAGIALLLAALGIYGVISYVVSQRTRELGIRIALGASQRRVVRLVVGHGLWMTVGGIALGTVAAAWLTRVIKSMLFDVAAVDPVTFALVPLTLLAVAVFASWVPARRAAKVDPVVTMRAE